MSYYYRFFIISIFFCLIDKPANSQDGQLQVLDTLSATGFILVEKGILDNERYYFFRSDKNVLPGYSARKWKRIKRRMPEIILPGHFEKYRQNLLAILRGLQQNETCKNGMTKVVEKQLPYWSPGTRFVSTIFLKVKNPDRKVNKRSVFLVPACLTVASINDPLSEI